MIEGLSQRLEASPGDLDGWKMLGWSYFNTGRFPEAAEAYARAAALAPQDAGLLSHQGEALVRAADGRVTPEAEALFDQSRAIDASDPTAAFYRGLSMFQGGDKAGALAIWTALLPRADEGDAWLPEMRGLIEQTAPQLGLDPSAKE
jgi:cytochrome c-type biogenesis protein CcmH